MPEKQKPDKQKKVLIVDDDPAVQDLLTRVLRLNGFVPVHATNLAEAKTVASANALSGIILDLRLRGESGLDLLPWIRLQPRHTTVPVMMLTGATELQEAEETVIKQHGAYVFYKPNTYRDLIAHLKKLAADGADR